MTLICTACGERVVRAVLPNGKEILVEAQASLTGNLFVRTDGEGVTRAYEVTWPDAVKHQEHRCTQENAWKKR